MSGAPPEDRLYLRHILDAVVRIEGYLQGVEQSAFEATPLLQDGVIRQLEIIGEASKRLSDATRAQASSVPWRQVMGMRDKLTHDYMGVDVNAVWLTARDDLTELKAAVSACLAASGGD